MIHENYSARQRGNVKVVAIGKKGSDFFNKNKNVYAGNHNDVFNALNLITIAAIAEEIMRNLQKEIMTKLF